MTARIRTKAFCVMSVSVLERMFANALSLAEQHLRAEGRIAPMLYFSGPGGEAVLRLDLSTPAEEGQLLAKATLMATALGRRPAPGSSRDCWSRPARRCVPRWSCSARTGAGRARPLPRSMPRGPELRLVRFDTPLGAPGIADGAGPLARFIHRHDAENAAAEAWRELEAMGVNRSDGRRPVH